MSLELWYNWVWKERSFSGKKFWSKTVRITRNNYDVHKIVFIIFADERYKIPSHSVKRHRRSEETSPRGWSPDCKIKRSTKSIIKTQTNQYLGVTYDWPPRSGWTKVPEALEPMSSFGLCVITGLRRHPYRLSSSKFVSSVSWEAGKVGGTNVPENTGEIFNLASEAVSSERSWTHECWCSRSSEDCFALESFCGGSFELLFELALWRVGCCDKISESVVVTPVFKYGLESSELANECSWDDILGCGNSFQGGWWKFLRPKHKKNRLWIWWICSWCREEGVKL